MSQYKVSLFQFGWNTISFIIALKFVNELELGYCRAVISDCNDDGKTSDFRVQWTNYVN